MGNNVPNCDLKYKHLCSRSWNSNNQSIVKESSSTLHTTWNPRESRNWENACCVNKVASNKYLHFIIEFSLPCVESFQSRGMASSNHAELFNKITSTIIIIFFGCGSCKRILWWRWPWRCWPIPCNNLSPML